jgi:CxxC-x17-CxxC domain-containing protein
MDEERNNGNFSDRPMIQGEWQCADCKKTITELPFQPNEDQEVRCKECYVAQRSTRRSDRPMVQGEWQCSDCGKDITELPFQPIEGRPIYCRDCYRNNRTR